MADNTQIVDHILKQEGQGTYSVYFKDLTDTDKQSIQAWLKDNIQYNDVQGAPELPSDNKAYDENNNIKPFDKLAFTANYDDLNNAPTIPDIGGERPTAFNPIAFTGVVNLDNVAVSNVINLNEYSINSNDAEHVAGMTENDISNNNTKLQNIGSSDNFVKGLNAFQRNGNGILLFNTLQSKIISGGFLITKTPTYLVSNSGIYFLTDVKNTTWDGPTLQYFELHLVAVTDSNYTTIRTYEANITDETAEEILENIELTAKNVILIFDFSNNILYCKTKEIGKEQEQGILEETDPVFAASPAANITLTNINTWDNKISASDLNSLLSDFAFTNLSPDDIQLLPTLIFTTNYFSDEKSFQNNSIKIENDTFINDIAILLKAKRSSPIVIDDENNYWYIINYTILSDYIILKFINFDMNFFDLLETMPIDQGNSEDINYLTQNITTQIKYKYCVLDLTDPNHNVAYYILKTTQLNNGER